MISPLLSGVILTLIEGVSDVVLKKYAVGDGTGFLVIGLGGYAMLGTFLAVTFRYNKLAAVNSYWDAGSNVWTIFLGRMFFNETYTATQYFGLGLILVGTVLLC